MPLYTVSPPSPPQGRLTLTTAVPVLTTGVAAAATVYYTPYIGNSLPIWNGLTFVQTAFSELSNVLANSSVGNAGPAAGAASQNYDLFVWNNNGTLTLTRGPVWTNGTTRSAGTDLVMVQGFLVNNAAITNGPAAGYGTYVGTIRTDAGGATVSQTFLLSGVGGALGQLNVWNKYNRTLAACRVFDTTASWPYTSATPRSANGSDLNRVELVAGLNEDAVSAKYQSNAQLAAAVGALFTCGVGLDVNNAISGPRGQAYSAVAVARFDEPVGRYELPVGLGYHFLQAIERGDGTNTTTINANDATATVLNVLWMC